MRITLALHAGSLGSNPAGIRFFVIFQPVGIVGTSDMATLQVFVNVMSICQCNDKYL